MGRNCGDCLNKMNASAHEAPFDASPDAAFARAVRIRYTTYHPSTIEEAQRVPRGDWRSGRRFGDFDDLLSSETIETPGPGPPPVGVSEALAL
jgi:hypothetical protein